MRWARQDRIDARIIQMQSRGKTVEPSADQGLFSSCQEVASTMSASDMSSILRYFQRHQDRELFVTGYERCFYRNAMPKVSTRSGRLLGHLCLMSLIDVHLPRSPSYVEIVNISLSTAVL